MHFIFIPYGVRREIEQLLTYMESESFLMPIWKGDKKAQHWVKGGVRILPFGIIEYIFPKEYEDMVLTTLGADMNPYNLGKVRLGILRKLARAEPVPKFNKDKHFIWITEATSHIGIIPIGVRYDKDYTEPKGKFEGWTHEGL